MKAIILCLITSQIARAVDWRGNNWAMGCDFRGNDLSNVRTPGEQCGGRCAGTNDCTHFTWTNFQGGTCWMKRGAVSRNDAFDTDDKSVVCGIIEEKIGGTPSSGGRDRLNNILATRHVNGGGDACALPSANYAVNLPFALGSIPELGYMSFKPDLCGHVLNIDCGNGAMDIIITNSNYGGGMDLYSEATWPRATNNKPPGEARCSAQLVNKNSISGSSYQCFYKPGTGTNNPWYRNVGLLNTEGKLVTGATVGGRAGQHRGDNPYYAFDLGRAIDANEEITFNFDDGSSHKVRFSQCVDTGSEQQWR